MKALAWSGVVVALTWNSMGWAQPAGAPPAQDPSKSVAVITKPDWLKKPTIDDLMAVYPRKAAQQGASGKATIKCVVSIDGLLRSCTVISESPQGEGFGGAALALSSTFLMKPEMRNGAPVDGAVITIPINFQTESGVPTGPSTGSHIDDSNSRNVTILRAPVWDKTPAIPDIQTEIDKKVGDKFADGKVVLQCLVAKKSGRISNCTVASASPGMAQFQGVARSLTSKFQADPKILANIKTDVMINLAFSFPDMASEVWGKRYLTRPQWIRTPTFEPGQKTFPDEAAKAGLKTGSATVDCIVAADGGLTQCAVASESTPGVGFGVMAVQIAQGFATNPWTDDGVPAGGAHVRLPIQLVDPGPAQPALGAKP
jgi:TonB family protein